VGAIDPVSRVPFALWIDSAAPGPTTIRYATRPPIA
jgi:hypothetical protein